VNIYKCLLKENESFSNTDSMIHGRTSAYTHLGGPLTPPFPTGGMD